MQAKLNEYADRFVDYLEAEKHASRYTVRNYRSDLLGNPEHGVEKGFFPFLESRGVTSLEKVDKALMREYLGHLIEQKVAKVSLARRLSAIRSFYRYLMREHLIERNPIELIVSPKLERHLPEFLTIDEMSKLLRMPDMSTPLGRRDRAIMELFYAAGMRVSELASLDMRQMDLDSREVRVMGKGNKERIVIIGMPAVRAIETYLREVRPALAAKGSRDAVFLNYKGGRLTERWVQKQLIKYAHAAGLLKSVHPHVLRHTFATHLLDGGADLRVVQDLLGHANLATTQIYTHVTQNQARRVYMASHPMAEKGKHDEHDKGSSEQAADYSI
jgi:tyrosine recombinase XerC